MSLSSLRRTVMAILVVALLGMGAGTTHAQLIEKAPPPTFDYEVDFDLYNMLMEPRDVEPGSIRDHVWQITAGPGRTLIALPFSIEPHGSEEIVLNSRTFAIRGGIFIAYRVADPDEYATAGSFDEEQLEEQIPKLSPRVASEIIITPQKTVKWKMDRFIRGAEVIGGDNEYAYKLSRELLDGKRPGTPPTARRNPNEVHSAYVTRTQQERATWQAANQEFRQLSDRVRALPEAFEVPLPPRIWVIFEVSQFQDPLQIDGPPPLPWVITRQQLQTVQRASGSTRAGAPVLSKQEGLPSAYRDYISEMRGMVTEQEPHPFHLRIIAYAISSSRLTQFATPNDNLYQLLLRIGTGSDTRAKRVIVKELLETFPPTSASTQLLAITGRDALDESFKTVRLQNLMRSQERDPATLQDILGEANRVLSDANASAVVETIDALLEVAKDTPAAMGMFTGGIRFQSLSDEQLDAVIVRITNAAPRHDLAARWFDNYLLGSSDARVSKRTLEILATSERGANVLQPVAGGLLTAVFGRPTQAAEQQPTGDRGPALQLDQPLLIDASRHAIFRQLQSGDPQIRELAWQVLPLFQIGTRDESGARVQPGAQQDQQANLAEAGIYSTLLDIARGQNPTPIGVVDFFAQQPNDGLAGEALVSLVLRGTSQASIRSSRALLEGRRNVGAVIRNLSYGDRHEFGKRMYQNTQRVTPLVTALLRADPERHPVVTWFAEQLATGRLPAPAQWVEAYRHVDELIELIVTNDQELAYGASAALVAAAGGNERVARTVTDLLRDLPDQSIENLRSQWDRARQSIYKLRIQEAAGVYRMSVLVYDNVPSSSPGQPADLTGLRFTQMIPLGIVPLQVSNETISLGNESISLSVPTDHLAIRVDSPAELKSFPHDEMAKLPLEQADRPADLILQADGSWRGQIPLAQGKVVEVLMQPLNP